MHSQGMAAFSAVAIACGTVANFSERFEQEKMLKPWLDPISSMPFERRLQSNCEKALRASSPRC